MELDIKRDDLGIILEKYGAFFAFSNEQLKEKAVEGTRYTSLGAGLISPSDNVKALCKEIKLFSSRKIKKDIKENTIECIIKRELYNHEAQVSGSIEDTANALSGYPIKKEEINEVFKKLFI